MTYTPRHRATSTRDRHAPSGTFTSSRRISPSIGPDQRPPTLFNKKMTIVASALAITTALTGFGALGNHQAHPATASHSITLSALAADAPAAPDAATLADRAVATSRSSDRLLDPADAAIVAHQHGAHAAVVAARTAAHVRAVAHAKAVAKRKAAKKAAAARAKARRIAAAERKAAAREVRRLAATAVATPVTSSVPSAGNASPSAPIAVPSGSVQALAHQMMLAYGWGEDQWAPLANLIQRESGWRVDATNSGSGAYGLPQSLPGSKMASVGADWRTNPATQLTWMFGYVKERYLNPAGAWAHSEAVGWY